MFRAFLLPGQKKGEVKCMKTILCFGDSNTYGYKPDGTGRFAGNVRWTGILKEKLTGSAEVIEEGLVGRTTVFEDSLRPGRKGIELLYPLLESHSPVDQLVLMLGTNDCKTHYKASAKVIGLGIERVIKEARRFNEKLEILLLSPIHLGDRVWEDGFDPEFSKESVEVSRELAGVYRKIAEKYHCRFLAASDVAKPSEADQEHLDETGHKALAEAIERIISEEI